MVVNNITNNAVALVHPINGSYVLIDDDGNIRIGTKTHGDIIFIHGVNGSINIDANKLRFITDKLEWNELVFNSAAANPTQPTFTKTNSNKNVEELSKYT